MRISDWSSDVCSSDRWVIFRTHNCSLREAREIVKQRVLDKEQEFLRERERVLQAAEPGSDYEVLKKYTGYLQLMFASYLVHLMHCPRYIVEPGRSVERRVGKECVSKGRSGGGG